MSHVDAARVEPRSSTRSGSATATMVELSGSSIVASAAAMSTSRSLGQCAGPALTGLTRLLGRANSLGERLKQVPPDSPVLLDERTEVPVGESPADEVCRGGDRCGPSAFIDHRELAERVARPQSGPLLAVHADDGLAVVDQEERGAARPLA